MLVFLLVQMLSTKINMQKNVSLNGVSENFFLTEQIEIIYGRNFILSDYYNFSRVAIIYYDLAKSFLKKPSSALNSLIDINGNSYLVVGFYKNSKREVSLDGNVLGGKIYLTNTQLAKEFNEKKYQRYTFISLI